jgi:hypothetical protein
MRPDAARKSTMSPDRGRFGDSPPRSALCSTECLDQRSRLESSAVAFLSAIPGKLETGLVTGFRSPADDLAGVGLLESSATSITAIWCPSIACGNRTQRMCLYGPRSNEQKHIAPSSTSASALHEEQRDIRRPTRQVDSTLAIQQLEI